MSGLRRGASRSEAAGRRASLTFVVLLALGAGCQRFMGGEEPAAGEVSAVGAEAEAARGALLAAWRAAPPKAESPGSGGLRRAEAAWQAELGRKALVALQQELMNAPTEEAWAWLVATAARWPQQTGLSADQARLLLSASSPPGDGPDAAAWRAARAWLSLAANQPDQALAVLGQPSAVDLMGLTAHLRAVQQLGQDPRAAAWALHRAFPADREGCRAAARSARASLEYALLDEVIESCQDPESTPYLKRQVADALDEQGRSADACALYLEAGAELHAAAILVQDGGCGPTVPDGLPARALREDNPEARLHTLWAALLEGEQEAIQAASSAMLAAGEDRGPPARAALASAWLALGQPFAASSLLDSGAGEGAAVQILRARVAQAVGDGPAALRLADEALAAAPDELGAHRARLVLLAELDPARCSQAVDELAAVDPVALEILSRSVDRMLPWRGVAPGAWPFARLDPSARALLEATLRQPRSQGRASSDRRLAAARLAGVLLFEPTPDRAQVQALVDQLSSPASGQGGGEVLPDSLIRASRALGLVAAVSGEQSSASGPTMREEAAPVERWALMLERLAAGDTASAAAAADQAGPPGEDPRIRAALRASLSRALHLLDEDRSKRAMGTAGAGVDGGGGARSALADALDTVRLLD